MYNIVDRVEAIKFQETRYKKNLMLLDPYQKRCSMEFHKSFNRQVSENSTGCVSSILNEKADTILEENVRDCNLGQKVGLEYNLAVFNLKHPRNEDEQAQSQTFLKGLLEGPHKDKIEKGVVTATNGLHIYMYVETEQDIEGLKDVVRPFLPQTSLLYKKDEYVVCEYSELLKCDFPYTP